MGWFAIFTGVIFFIVLGNVLFNPVDCEKEFNMRQPNGTILPLNEDLKICCSGSSYCFIINNSKENKDCQEYKREEIYGPYGVTLNQGIPNTIYDPAGDFSGIEYTFTLVDSVIGKAKIEYKTNDFGAKIRKYLASPKKC